MAKKKAKKRNEAKQQRREVLGVVLVAVGVFLAVCQHIEAIGVVGKYVTGILFGLCGLFAYALPFAMLAGGIVLIVFAPETPQKGRTALVVTGLYLLVTLLHVTARPLLGEGNFLAYVVDAYKLGADTMRGGGGFGALLSYPVLLLVGEAGAYIFLIASILIVVLCVTRLSLRETGRQVKQKVQAGLEQVNLQMEARKQAALFTDDIEAYTPPRPQKRPAQKKRPLVEHTASDLDELEFLPLEGPIAKKRPGSEAAAPSEEAAFDICPDAPAITYYDEGAGEPDDFAAIPVLGEQTTLRRPKVTSPFVQDTPPFDVDGTTKQTPPPLEEEQLKIERVPYVPPSFSLLNPPQLFYGRSMENPADKAKLLTDTLESFHVSAKVINISVGPVITRFELAPAPGVRVNKITALSDDIALALAAPRVRIEAPIPGKAAVGIEIPNKDTATVVLRDIVESKEFTQAKSPITLAIGKDIAGKIIVADLAKMPHLLIAGATGSGKSVCINDIIISLVYKCTPDELQLILVDPKVVELSAFSVLPHLKVPVVTDPKKAAGALASGVREMTERYQRFAKLGARDLARYNELQQNPQDRLPKLVIIIDELADLMMVAPDTVEDSICRIAQLGRAAGIHLIVATQRPSADIITGLIKANIPSRIAFAVSSAIDSRIILDVGGAEKLLGRGDMLFHPNGAGKPLRAQGAFVSDEEVERIVRHFEAQSISPNFDAHMLEEMEAPAPENKQGNGKQEDELLGEAVRIVLESGQASISMIQRRLRVGYARAARLVDIMEQRGFVSGFDGSKPRKLLITRGQYEQLFGAPAAEAACTSEDEDDA